MAEGPTLKVRSGLDNTWGSDALGLDTSVCFGVEPSVVIKKVNGHTGEKLNMYRLWVADDVEQSMIRRTAGHYQEHQDKQAVHEPTGAILMPSDEIWEVSSIEVASEDKSGVARDTTLKGPEESDIYPALESVVESVSAAIKQVVRVHD